MAIAVPVVRAGQTRTNRLAVATALIFFSCAVGHALHAAMYWRTSFNQTAMPGIHETAGWSLTNGTADDLRRLRLELERVERHLHELAPA
jgi:hypothetical protein